MTAAAAALLWASDAVCVAELDPDGTVRAANPALERLAGRPLAGTPIAALVAEAQRPVFLRALIGVRETAAGLRVALAGDDRSVRMTRDGDGLLLIAEPVHGEQERMTQEMLALNEDLIGAQREATRHGRALERSRAEARAATERVRRLEAVVLAGLVRPDVPSVLDALLAVTADVVGGDGAAVRLRDERTGALAVVAATGANGAGSVLPAGAAADLRVEGEVIGRLEAWGEGVDPTLLRAVAERGSLALGHVDLDRRRRDLADALQRAVLPAALPEVGGVELCARYLPRVGTAGVGGDFYDAIVLEDGRLALSIGDVAGKGLAAASTMGRLCHALRAYAAEGVPAEELLVRLDRLAMEDEEQMATALHLRLHPGTGDLRYANAGHLPVLRVGASGETSWLRDGLSAPLGLGLDVRPAATAALAPGDRLLLFTDGLVERRGEVIDAGLERLAAGARAVHGVDGLCHELVDRIRARDGDFEDDVAVLAVEVSGGR